MTQEILNLSDPSSSGTINHYLREGRRLQSLQAWAVVHAITHSMLHRRAIQAPFALVGVLLLASSLQAI